MSSSHVMSQFRHGQYLGINHTGIYQYRLDWNANRSNHTRHVNTNVLTGANQSPSHIQHQLQWMDPRLLSSDFVQKIQLQFQRRSIINRCIKNTNIEQKLPNKKKPYYDRKRSLSQVKKSKNEQWTKEVVKPQRHPMLVMNWRSTVDYGQVVYRSISLR